MRERREREEEERERKGGSREEVGGRGERELMIYERQGYY